MKNIFKPILFIGLSLVTVTSCSPLDDTYAELDAKTPLITTIKGDISYTLLDADYASIDPTTKTDSYEKNKNFTSEKDALEKIPAVLFSKLVRVEGATAVVKYNLYAPTPIVSTSITYEATAADYDSQGGNVAKYKNFSKNSEIITFLKSKYPTATPGTLVKLTYVFNGPVKLLTTGFLFNSTSVWEEDSKIILAATDYTAMGQAFANFENKETAQSRIGLYLKSTLRPFAVKGDSELVDYIYSYKNASNVRVNEDTFVKYTYNGSTWDLIAPTTEQSLNFKFKKGVWVSNNVIKYTFLPADYTNAAAGLTADDDLKDEVGNLASFGNFNRTTGITGWDNVGLLKAFNVVLKKNYPTTLAGQEYLLSISVYNGSNSVESFSVFLNDKGDYEFVK